MHINDRYCNCQFNGPKSCIYGRFWDFSSRYLQSLEITYSVVRWSLDPKFSMQSFLKHELGTSEDLQNLH